MENQEPYYENDNQDQSRVSGIGNNFNSQVPLPNSTVILILGIATIVTCCCYGIVGVICGIITLIMAKSAKDMYEANPSAYTSSSYSNVNAGRICAIIGLVLSALYIIGIIAMIAIYGVTALSNPDLLMNSVGV